MIVGLQKLRDLVGVPIHVSSGFRCAAYNKGIGGYAHSQHVLGRAADFFIEGYSSVEAFVVAEQIPEFRNGGLGVYRKKGHLHGDVRKARARWGFMELIAKKKERR